MRHLVWFFIGLLFSCSTPPPKIESQGPNPFAPSVERALKPRYQDIQACFKDQPDAIIVIRFVVEGTSGRVKAAVIQKMTLDLPKVASCLLDVVTTSILEKTPSGADLQVIYAFAPEKIGSKFIAGKTQ